VKVTIIGAGIGGTSAGIALKRLGHDVHIYERVTQNKPVGAALSLWSNGVKVLNWLGLADDVKALGGDMAQMAYFDGISGDLLCQFGLESITIESGQKPYPVARADLQALLMETFGIADISFGKSMTAVGEDAQGAWAEFADGEKVYADLLIGADGAKSLVREYVNGISERSYCGYTNFNGLVPVNDAIGPADAWTQYVADGKRVSVMPVADDRFYFFFDVTQPAGLSPDPAAPKAELHAAFDGWAPSVKALIDAIDPAESLNRVEVWDITPFHTWVKGRIAILGDAAHNTSPDVGQGACSALEDTFVLATVLAANTNGIEDSLKRYEAARTERAADLVLKARKRAAETHGFV
jgi:FAD-dependent urate hydroxylase